MYVCVAKYSIGVLSAANVILAIPLFERIIPNVKIYS